jgi:hypothetical protein
MCFVCIGRAHCAKRFAASPKDKKRFPIRFHLKRFRRKAFPPDFFYQLLVQFIGFGRKGISFFTLWYLIRQCKIQRVLVRILFLFTILFLSPKFPYYFENSLHWSLIG